LPDGTRCPDDSAHRHRWNLTITGSIANIIVVERAAAEGVQIGFSEFLRIGVPVTVATLACGAGWLWMTG
jgi:Na+/H+ antiporter NhaD/arsenite permease-like protein